MKLPTGSQSSEPLSTFQKPPVRGTTRKLGGQGREGRKAQPFAALTEEGPTRRAAGRPSGKFIGEPGCGAGQGMQPGKGLRRTALESIINGRAQIEKQIKAITSLAPPLQIMTQHLERRLWRKLSKRHCDVCGV